MTYEMEYLMHLYACGAAGRPAEAPSEAVDWERLISLAVGQSITYTVAMAVKKSQTGCPEAVKRRLLSSLMGASYAKKLKRRVYWSFFQGLSSRAYTPCFSRE